MKIKTSELTGAPLNYAVALAEGYTKDTYLRGVHIQAQAAMSHRVQIPKNRNYVSFMPATSWLDAGPIIEREGIGFYKANGTKWWAHPYGGEYNAEGPTPLVAAMRCYVASKLGAEVEVPEGLA